MENRETQPELRTAVAPTFGVAGVFRDFGGRFLVGEAAKTREALAWRIWSVILIAELE